jgi:branched-chain amino acid transport system substrate-binding protein
MIRSIFRRLIPACLAFLVLARTGVAFSQGAESANTEIRVGWVGGMSGPTAKYGAYQSALLAEEDINNEGGINGRPFKLIFEDGKGTGKTAVSAAQKLMSADRVSFIVGGHSTPESLPMAPMVERNGALMLAAITSSPKLTGLSRNFFRVTAVSLQGASALAQFAVEEKGISAFGVVYVLTDYAQPLAEGFRDEVLQRKGRVPVFEGLAPGDLDARPLLLRMKRAGVTCLYLGIQSPEAAVAVLQQAAEISFHPLLLGNEITGNAVTTAGDRKSLFEGLVFAEPEFDLEAKRTKAFIKRYKARFGVESLPYGFWSAEAYDAVRLLAETIGRCGEEVSAVRACLLSVHNYQGVSGPISINEQGDGVRKYLIKRINADVPVPVVR